MDTHGRLWFWLFLLKTKLQRVVMPLVPHSVCPRHSKASGFILPTATPTLQPFDRMELSTTTGNKYYRLMWFICASEIKPPLVSHTRQNGATGENNVLISSEGSMPHLLNLHEEATCLLPPLPKHRSCLHDKCSWAVLLFFSWRRNTNRKWVQTLWHW